MPMILIKCPVTQEPLPTNMSMERESFELSDLSRNSTSCPHCGGIHIWDKKDAWLEKAKRCLTATREGLQSDALIQGWTAAPHYIVPSEANR
jgi:hypothetical protein